MITKIVPVSTANLHIITAWKFLFTLLLSSDNYKS